MTMSGIQAARAELLDIDRKHYATVRVVIDYEAPPEVIMFNGEPFLLEIFLENDEGSIFYRRVRPYRVDASQIEAPR
jgi:hypothetical protein